VKFFDPRANRGQSLNASLSEADAFLTVNPRARYGTSQLRGLVNFTDNGGRLVVLSDPAALQISGFFFGSIEEVPSRTTGVTSPYGVEFGGSELYNVENNENHYSRIPVSGESGSLAEGVDSVVFDGATPLVASEDATVSLRAAEGTTLEANRRQAAFPVAAQNGDVAMVGDSDFITPDDAYVADNEVLIGNIADFLVSGEKTMPSAPQPEGGEQGGGGPPFR
jgi:hypothetical protein